MTQTTRNYHCQHLTRSSILYIVLHIIHGSIIIFNRSRTHPHLLVDLYYSVGRAIQNQLFNENKIIFYRCDGTLYLDWNKLAMILFLPR